MQFDKLPIWRVVSALGFLAASLCFADLEGKLAAPGPDC